MALKDQWKETGKELGGAFSGLGKNIVRSVKGGVDKATDWADPEKEGGAGKDSNVFNDGSWRETGKDLGGAFTDLGKSIVNSAKQGADKASDWAEDRREGNAAADSALPDAGGEESNT